MLFDAREVINGCKVFDTEHMLLVNLLNAVYKLLKEGKREKAKELFKKGVIEYTEKHLRHEEEVMERFGYPDLERHKKTHETFRKVIAEDIKNLEDPKVFASEAALAMGWVVSHIKKTDRKYVDYFKQKGVWEDACKALEKAVKLEIEEKLKEILGKDYVDPREVLG
jgi:hemerythrin